MHLVIAVLKVFSVSVPTERKRCNVCVRIPAYVHNDSPSPEYPYFGGRATPSLYILLGDKCTTGGYTAESYRCY